MTSHDLLDAIGNARDRYLLETQVYREYQVPVPEVKKLPLKRILLIAAVIALALTLVGCTVVYVLSLQEMKVGEHTYTEAAAVEEKTSTLISLQGVYQPALREWIAFLDSYDPDGQLLAANDRNQSAVPEPYHLVYGCYTWEMVEKLDEIIGKYDLELLEPYVLVEAEESFLLLDALGLVNLHHEDSAEVTYAGGYFYPEGTFQMNMYAKLPGWERERLVQLRYSLNEYFDPVYGSLGDIESYTQWTYTTVSGIPVLLAKNDDHARIYASLPDAFLSIQTTTMTGGELEALADVFDYSIRTHYADPEILRQKQAKFAAEAEAARADAEAKEAELFARGMENYAAYRYGQDESLCYSPFDINGDGLDELIIRDSSGNCYEVVSQNPMVNGGQAYLYFDTLLAMRRGVIHPCTDDKAFALIHNSEESIKYYFYRAGEYFPEFIEAVTYNKAEQQWYYIPDDDPWTEDNQTISSQSAEDVIRRYDFETLPPQKSLLDYVQTGELNAPAEDPYRPIIQQYLQSNPENRKYALRDLNDDGIEELLILGPVYHGAGMEKIGESYSLFTQQNGEIIERNIIPFDYVCRDNTLEDYWQDEKGNYCHTYYTFHPLGLKLVEMVEYEGSTDTWTVDYDGHWGNQATVITESRAWEIINSHPRMDPGLKDFAEYPLR